ncbi:GHKL domain-containing protein [Latilactobacillus graminis]|nr:GHKL domain-containing protein [Latilactobacillus graminis]QFP79517.1 sensor histidine kinase [Latilactobacillus graminis]
MTMSLSMHILVNLGMFSNFFLLTFYLLDYLNPRTLAKVVGKTAFGVFLVELVSWLLGSWTEDICLIVIIGVMFVSTFGLEELIQLKTNFRLIGSTAISFIIVTFSTIISKLIMAELGNRNLVSVPFIWPTVILIIILQLILATICGIFVKVIFKLMLDYVNRYGIWMAITVITGLILFVGAVIVLMDDFKYKKISAEYLLLVLSTIIILTVIVIIGMFLYVQVVLQQNKINLERKNRQHLMIYVEQLERNFHEVRKFRHDIANALLALEIIVNEQANASLSQNFRDLLAHYNFDTIQNKVLGRFQDINNDYLKGIIFSKYIEAQNYQVNFNLEVQPNLFQVNKQYFDEFRILGILLDNAIDAAKDSQNKTMTVSLFEQNNKIVYRIKNAISEPIEFGKLYRSGYSTKGNQHGIGLTTVKEIVDGRTDFHLNLEQINTFFVAMLVVKREANHG